MGLAFKLLKKSCNVGDRVVITSSTGTSEGIILDIDDFEVALELDDGGFLTTRGDDIIAMKTIGVKNEDKKGTNDDIGNVKQPQTLAPTITDVPLKDSNKSNEVIGTIPQPPIAMCDANITEKEENNKEGEVASELEKEDVLSSKEITSDTEQSPTYSQKKGSIPLDDLLTMQWKNSTWKRQTYRKMISAIERIGDYRNDDEFKKSLPLKGQFSPMSEGIIIDSFSGKKYFYNTDELLFPRYLYNSSVYFINENEILKDILPASKLSDILGYLEIIIKKEQLGNTPKLPIKIVNVLMRILPNNLTLTQLYNDLKSLIYQFSVDKTPVHYKRNVEESVLSPNSASQIAKRLTNQKRHEEALSYYLEAIAKGENTVSCIHVAANTYQNLYKQARKSTAFDALEKAEKIRQEGIAFMQKNKKFLPDEDKTTNMLENFYYSICDYDGFFEILPKVMAMDKVKNDLIRWSTFMNKKASAQMATEQYEEARQTIREALKVNPDNLGAQRIQEALNKMNQLNEALKHADTKEAKEEIKEELEKIRRTDFSTFTDGGMGIFITQTIDEYTEMEDLPLFVKAKEDYTEQTLRTTRKRIDDAGKSRPAERAKLILTEVKLMQMLDKEIDRIPNEMAHYCQAMAELSLYQNDIDVARFYYDQSFALLQNSKAQYDRYIWVYLKTLAYTPREILDEIHTPAPPLEEMVDLVLTTDVTQQQWEAIITLLLYNSDVTGKIVGCLYRNTVLRHQSFDLMKHFKISQPADESEAEFIKGWDQVREKRLNDRRRLSNQIKSLIESCTKLEDVDNSMKATLMTCRSEEWLTATLDLQRLGAIIDTVLSPVSTYIASKGYTPKFNARNNINSQIKSMQEDIRRRPTKLSFEAILPLLSHIHKLVEAAFNTVLLTSKPDISITLPADETVVERGNMVSLQVKIANGENAAPINNVTVEILTTNGVLSDTATEESGIQIEGGKEHIFKHRIKVSDDVIHNESTSVDIVCYYRDREGVPDKERDNCSLTLYSRENFQDIENPYKPGDKLRADDPTFKGRTTDIKVVVDGIKKVKPNEPGKQFIIYGQKRCGKSSVLERIKKQLEAEGYFCFDFSLEKIAKTINDFTFYHEILKALRDKLRQLRNHSDDPAVVQLWGTDIPPFELPGITDFEKENPYNPVDTFEEYMSKFRAECQNFPKWKDCKMVLMIDEFTAIYAGVEDGRIDPSIMKQWKAFTQHPDCNFSVVLVGQDVTPAFMNEPYAANAFRIIEGRRLTYLPLNDARDLVEEPMTKACGEKSPYIGKAVERIIDYTSRNPYYIQLMCTKLVQYINKHQLKKVTEADIDDLADQMKYELDDGMFDNLINAGEEIQSPKYQKKKDEIMTILTALASLSKGRGYDYCSNDDIEGITDKERQLEILEELEKREVLEKKEGSYKIQVRLFKEWLLR